MNKISRRQLLKTVGISSVFFALPEPLLASTRNPLNIPPLLSTKKGKPILLNLSSIQKALDGKNYVEVWGFNGSYLGPTLKLQSGKFAKINWQNNLTSEVAVQIQGLQAMSALSGGINHKLKPNTSWSPVIPIKQPSATCYYQACTLGKSAYQNYRGLVGLCLIEDKQDLSSELPNKYGKNDIPLILQDLSLDASGHQLFNSESPYFYGDRLFVNGQTTPYINVGSELIRLRLLNASLSRSYSIRCDDNRPFQLLAEDQGFLSTPQSCTSKKIAPGERIEILVNLMDGKNVSLIANGKNNFLDKMSAIFSSDSLKDNIILELRTNGLGTAFPKKSQLTFNNSAQDQNQNIRLERQLKIDPDTFTINGQKFDSRRIDINTKAGTTERWIIQSQQPMAFRIQGAKFFIESQDGQRYPLEQRSWKDTLWINKETHIIVKFEQRSSNNYPFTFGASDLTLADRGCLGLMIVK